MGKGGPKPDRSGGKTSWQGGGGENFDPKTSGRLLGNDIIALHKQGPRVFEKSLHTGMSSDTRASIKDLMGRGSNVPPGMIEESLGATARGENIGKSNPYISAMLDKAVDDTRSDVNAQFSGSGRYGSNIHAEQLTESLGGLRTKVLGNQIDKDLAAQRDALSRISGERGRLRQEDIEDGKRNLSLNRMIDANEQAERMAEYDLFQRKDPFSHLQKSISLEQMMRGNPGMKAEKKYGFGNFLGDALKVGTAFL